METPL